MRCFPLLSGMFLALFIGLSTVSIADAKPPSRKDVDEALLRMSGDDLQGVQAAEKAVGDGQAELDRIQSDVDVAKLEQKAAKSWVDAVDAILKAIEAGQAAAEAGGDTNTLAELKSRQVQAQAQRDWRSAQFDASKWKIDYQQARVSWAKTQLQEREQGVELERLRAYNKSINGSPEIEVEIGKAQTQYGKAQKATAKDNDKVKKAEGKWDAAARKADDLAPGEG